MNEFFLAGDSPDLWREVSREALKEAGFSDIRSTPDGTLSAFHNGSIDLSFKPSKEGGTVIGIKTDDPADAGLYKQYAAQCYNRFKTALKAPEPEEEEPLGSPDSVKPNMEQAFKPAYPQVAKPATPQPAPQKAPASEAVAEERVPFYQTDWFTLLLLILLPPVGLIMMWAFKVFDKKLRIGLTVFFLLYTVLWGWLLYLPFIPSTVSTEEQNVSQTEQLSEYWDNMYVTEFRTEMPAQMDEYESLYLNGMLISDTGLSRARVIFPEVQALCTQVLSLDALPESDPAYPVQQSVNAAANSFNNAIAAGQDALDQNDPSALADTTDLWNTAMNAFYQIDYIYDQALNSAEIADGVIPEDTQTTVIQDTTVDEQPAQDQPAEQPATDGQAQEPVEQPAQPEASPETPQEQPTEEVQQDTTVVTDEPVQ